MARASAKTSGSRRRLWLGAVMLAVLGVSSAMAALKMREIALVIRSSPSPAIARMR